MKNNCSVLYISEFSTRRCSGNGQVNIPIAETGVYSVAKVVTPRKKYIISNFNIYSAFKIRLVYLNYEKNAVSTINLNAQYLLQTTLLYHSRLIILVSGIHDTQC